MTVKNAVSARYSARAQIETELDQAGKRVAAKATEILFEGAKLGGNAYMLWMGGDKLVHNVTDSNQGFGQSIADFGFGVAVLNQALQTGFSAVDLYNTVATAVTSSSK